MSESNKHPSDRRILALHDGELAPGEADGIRAHCASCAPCGQVLQEISSVGAVLARDAAAEPLRPIWPVVRDRLEEAEHPVFRPAFGLATAAAVAAGIVLGVIVGQPRASVHEEAGTYLWSVVGSNLGDGDTGSLSGAWTGLTLEEGEEAR